MNVDAVGRTRSNVFGTFVRLHRFFVDPNADDVRLGNVEHRVEQNSFLKNEIFHRKIETKIAEPESNEGLGRRFFAATRVSRSLSTRRR